MEVPKDYHKMYHVRILGEFGVGKTSLVFRIAQNKFVENPFIIGIDFLATYKKIDNLQYKVLLWEF